MPTVQVVYASRHGATAEIANRIAKVLRNEGLATELADAARKPDPAGFDAYVVGSGVYMGSWLGEAVDFLERHQLQLAMRPVWLFSSGPLLGSTKTIESDDPLTSALGPESGPGSGGRRKIVELSRAVRPRAHRIFMGAYDPTDGPKSMPERFLRLMPRSDQILPAGDFRDWPAIEAFAREIASALAPAPVAV